MMSMTGFGRASFELDGRAYPLELRSVNNRFLDVKIHLPWVDGHLEQRMRATVRGGLTRGRVDVTLAVDEAQAGGSVRLNVPLAREVATALAELAALLECDLATSARLLPPQRELLLGGGPPSDPDRVWGALEPCVEAAIGELRSMRAKEGDALRRDMEAQLDEIVAQVEEIRKRSAEEPTTRKDKLSQRLARLLADTELEPERLAMEAALIADRCDVTEELVRLASHVDQLRGMFGQSGAIGRKIEFMLQEVNRELNTVASKTGDAETSTFVVEAKGHLEKLREQAQNVE